MERARAWAPAGGNVPFKTSSQGERGRKKFSRTEAEMSMKTKETSGKMPEKKSEKVGHLGTIQGFKSDICARLNNNRAIFCRYDGFYQG